MEGCFCRKIVDYILCEETPDIGCIRPIETIGESVIKYIEKGYQPFGSPLINNHGIICQAMVKYEEENL